MSADIQNDVALKNFSDYTLFTDLLRELLEEDI